MATLESWVDEDHRRAEEAAKKILSSGSFSERLGGALLVLLGFIEVPSTEKPRLKEEHGGLRQGLSGLFNGWH